MITIKKKHSSYTCIGINYWLSLAKKPINMSIARLVETRICFCLNLITEREITLLKSVSQPASAADSLLCDFFCPILRFLCPKLCLFCTKKMFTMTIILSVPPAWVLEPSDISVVLGTALELPCSSSGSPNPSVTWKKQTGAWWITAWHACKILMRGIVSVTYTVLLLVSIQYLLPLLLQTDNSYTVFCFSSSDCPYNS